jgi:hypothetical protein
VFVRVLAHGHEVATPDATAQAIATTVAEAVGFKRIRHYGLLAPAHKTRRLTQARAALAMPPPNPIAQETAA